MRTLVFVVMLLLVAIVAGLSFAVRVGAEPATPVTTPPTTAQLDFQCGDTGAARVLPSGVPTLISCTATVVNSGNASLAGAAMMFEPASVDCRRPMNTASSALRSTAWSSQSNAVICHMHSVIFQQVPVPP